MIAGALDSLQLGEALRDEYELLDELGRGAFGTVFKAVQKSTGQLVAIKVQTADQSGGNDLDVALLRRFEREVRLCASLNHPHIVRILDQGRRGKHVFIVFELVPGETLSTLLARRGALSPGEAVAIMAQVLEALDDAHTHGVLHRDLKPDNIMVISTGTQRHIKVLDFGIGAFTAAVGGVAMTVTRSQEPFGTPHYCAPEQLRGEPATARSDLYSWGLVLLECLTGRRVMDGATVAQVYYRQLNAREIPLPTALATHALGDILRRVLAKAPRERAGDAGKLWNDLRRIHTADLLTDLAPGAGSAGIGAATAPLDLAGGAGEKRQATVFCCSLTALPAPGPSPTTEPDVETLDAVQRDQLSLCTDVVSRFGGRVLGGLGDRLLVVFGVPDASDSDARRAAHAALELAARVHARRAALSTQRGIDLELRIGIHTGVVLIDVDGTPSGPALAVAARLEGMAPSGSALVSEATRELLAKQLRFQPFTVAGGGAPANRTKGYVLIAERSGEVARASTGGELIGRNDEWRALVESWIEACAGRGQVILIRGEPGIGKTRLVQEIRRRVFDDGGDSIDCQCLQEDNYTALHPIFTAIRQQFDLDRAAPAAGLARLESALASRGLAVSESVAILGPWLGLGETIELPVTQLSPERQRDTLLSVLAGLLCPATNDENRVIAIEDLHWSDPTTRELVMRLAAIVPAHRVLLLLTMRFDVGLSPANAQVLDLPGLGRDAVERLIALQSDGARLRPELVGQVVDRTDGVPLFVEELTRTLLEMQRTGSVPDRLGEGAVPVSLRDLLNARLSRLGAARETAQLAASIGREFDSELLTLISSRGGEAVQGDLDRLMEAQLVSRHWTTAGTRFLFRHALIREAAWESMLSAHRRAVHRTIAECIEAHFPEQAALEPAHLARHCELAGLAEKGSDYRLKAAQRALSGSAYQEAIEHLEAGLGLLDAMDESNLRSERQVELRNTLGGVLIATQGFAADTALTMFTRARQLLDTFDAAPTQRLTTLKGLWTIHNARASYALAEDIATQIMELATAHDRPEFHLSAHQSVAQNAFLVGRFQTAVAHSTLNDQWFDQAQQREQVIRYGVDPWMSALTAECISSALLGRVKHARARLDVGFAACERLASTTHEVSFLGQAAAVEMFLGTAGPRPNAALDLALTRAHKAAETGQRLGLRFGEVYARLLIAMIGASVGEEQALVDLQRSIDLWQLMGVRAALSWHYSFLARGQHVRRDYAAALQNARAALDHCERMGEGYGASESHRVLGTLLGDPENPDADARAAVVHCQQALSIARQQEARWLELQAARAVVSVVGSDSRVDALEQLGHVVAWFDREEEGLDLPFVDECRALSR